MQHLKTLLLVIVFFSVCNRLNAINPPPLNDTVCDAIDLGVLPVPGPCPSYPYGDTIHVTGTTDWASYNTFDFSPVACFPSGAPDVWYRFRGTGNYIYIELFGYGDLDSMFVKLYQSQGSCLDLIPGHCETTFNGTIMASILTPDIGGEYYLQIGGSSYDETGNFMFNMKSFNDCSDCIKNSHVELSPAPWFGRYGTSDTVKMCYTVDRWDQTTTSKLHSVIPLFGDEWDTTTLIPVSFPSTSTGWIWGDNIPTPLGSWDGFYFDADSNGDPTDNAGEPGNVTTSWEFCWQISTKPYCNAYDAHVDIHTNSDNVTGNGNAIATCNEAIPMHLSMAGWCCPDPIVSIQPGAACDSLWIIIVDPVSSNSGDVFNVVLYDDSMHAIAYSPGVTTTAGFSNVRSGDYLIEAYNTNTTCISFHQVHLPGAFEIELAQTVVGCGAGSGSVVATPNNSFGPFVYNWHNITTFTDSLAYGLNEGYVVVDVTNAGGCTVTDSIYVTVLPTPDAYFAYRDVSRCHDEDTIQTSGSPASLGGTFTLVSPVSTPITVDATTGTIYLNGATLTTPYWIHVQYTVGSVCPASYMDSVQIVQKPATPVPTSGTSVDWCIGATAPTLNVAFAAGIPSWYGLQTSQVGIGFSFTPTLSSTTAPGQYMYVVTSFADLSFGCAGGIATFTVNAVQAPSFTMSPDVTICPDDTAYIFANGSAAYTYAWQPQPTIGPQNVQATSTVPAGTTTYTVSVTDGPCISTGFVTVLIDSSITCGGTAIYSGITPNNDGHNDTWIIESAYTTTGVTVCIYNRWGQQVWKASNYDNNTVVFAGRNGKGEDLPSGTYYYTIQQADRSTAAGWLELTR